MRKPVYYAYVAQESHPDSQGEKKYLVDKGRSRLSPPR